MKKVVLKTPVGEALNLRIKDRVEQAAFDSTAEYVRSLIRQDLRSYDEEQLEALFADFLSSGRSLEREQEEMFEKFKAALVNAGRV